MDQFSTRGPVATYSIVARDEKTGEMGVAVQSHYFSVGPIVAWGEAGIGVVATQSAVDPAYGPRGLELMRKGKSAKEALEELLDQDPDISGRQVAMLDSNGAVDAYTGPKSIFAAGHLIGEQVSVQANLMEKETVWPAMLEAYEQSKSAGNDLAERLLKALEAAEQEGGDIRGKQSAAILVVAGENTGQSWVDQLFDLRVEDHPDPLVELRRLVTMRRAYNALIDAGKHLADKDSEKAMLGFSNALNLAPDHITHGEIPFWIGVTLINAGEIAEALPYLARAQKQHKSWIDLIPRLVSSGRFPDDAAIIQQATDAMQNV